MKEQNSNWLRVEEPKAIAFLADPKSASLLAPYFRGEKSVSEAAAEENTVFRRMYYVTHKALELGLLKLVSVQKRKGKAVKRYRCAAEAFFVPFHRMKKNLHDSRLARENRFLPLKLAAAAHSSPYEREDGDWGVLTKFDAEKGIGCFINSSKHRFENLESYRDHLLSKDTTPYLDAFFERVVLSDEDAKAFQRELNRVYLTYLKRGSQGAEGTQYIASIFLAQSPEC